MAKVKREGWENWKNNLGDLEDYLEDYLEDGDSSILLPIVSRIGRGQERRG